jgi:hypothetical protein
LWLALVYCGGILFGRYAASGAILAPVVVAVAAAAASLFVPRNRLATMFSFVAVFALAVFMYVYCEFRLMTGDLRTLVGDQPAQITLEGELGETPRWHAVENGLDESSYRARVPLILKGMETPGGWTHARGVVLATFVGVRPYTLECGDTVRACGTLRRIRPATNPGQFRMREFWHRRGIDYRFTVPGEAMIERRTPGTGLSFRRCIEKLRTRFYRGITHGLPDGPEKEILAAMVVGYRENMSD